ncbi:MAG: hypothetical protein A3D92_13010, partial [Bacteroidetes bacterium RIFCSPHIGHO2_02_FULL_44_7]
MKHRLNTLVLAVNITLVCLFLKESPYFIHFLVAAGLLYFIVLSAGVLFMQFNYFLPAMTRLNSDFCLLTFDDGPDPEITPEILDILKRHDIAALFFVIGYKADDHPDLVRRIQAEGHLLGNHSYDHNVFMSLFTRKRLREDIGKAQESIEKITGKRPHYFRPPIGYTNPRYAKVLVEKSLLCVGWTLRSYDSIFKQPHKLVQRLRKRIRPGTIVL